ncbi:hypothetical protein [Streptococcus sp. zg-JUN1979]|uniref:hypothetical protein n=1 Tax=Streptococcus sp. zg-JUN1979 TaxID=3391450 RepID=UPI0039AF0CF5
MKQIKKNKKRLLSKDKPKKMAKESLDPLSALLKERIFYLSDDLTEQSTPSDWTAASIVRRQLTRPLAKQPDDLKPAMRLALADYDNQYIVMTGVIGDFRTFVTKSGQRNLKMLILLPTINCAIRHKPTPEEYHEAKGNVQAMVDKQKTAVVDRFIDQHIWVDVKDMANICPETFSGLMIGHNVTIAAKVMTYYGVVTLDLMVKGSKYGLDDVILLESGLCVKKPNTKIKVLQHHKKYVQQQIGRQIPFSQIDTKGLGDLHWSEAKKRFVVNYGHALYKADKVREDVLPPKSWTLYI